MLELDTVARNPRVIHIIVIIVIVQGTSFRHDEASEVGACIDIPGVEVDCCVLRRSSRAHGDGGEGCEKGEGWNLHLQLLKVRARSGGSDYL